MLEGFERAAGRFAWKGLVLVWPPPRQTLQPPLSKTGVALDAAKQVPYVTPVPFGDILSPRTHLAGKGCRGRISRCSDGNTIRGHRTRRRPGKWICRSRSRFQEPLALRRLRITFFLLSSGVGRTGLSFR